MAQPHHRIWATLVLVALLATALVRRGEPGGAGAAGTGWVAQAYDGARAPANNPLKGLAAYMQDHEPYGIAGGNPSGFPTSMEWAYIPYSQLHTGASTYSWAPLDARLNAAASRGNQLVFRIYADYPNKAYAIPAWLDPLVGKYSYSDYDNCSSACSYAPDYNDPDLLSAFDRFIAALGARYDGDARLGAIMVGMVGFWGEWHTWRPSCSCDPWLPSTANRDRILGKFDQSFNTTRLVVRYPNGTTPSSFAIGYHDDSFAYETISPPAWNFTGRLAAAGESNKWQSQMIGGEVRPEIQSCIWNSPSCAPAGQEWNTSVDATHASWMVDAWNFLNTMSPTQVANATTGARRLGYELFVSQTQIPDGSTLQVNVRLQNRGRAPFYYSWKVQLGIWNGSSVVKTFDTAWDLRSVPATATDVQLSYANAGHGLPAGTYTVLMRVVNPLSGGKPLVFANQRWAQTTSGWLTLDTVTLTTTSPATSTPTRTPTRTPTSGAPAVTPTRTATAGGGALLLDNFDGTPAWPSANDRGRWTGANGFLNGSAGSGALSAGALVLQYNSSGWFGSDVGVDLSGKTYLVIRARGAAGGEQSHLHVILGGVDRTLGQLSGDTLTTSYKDIRINMSAVGMNRAAPGQLQLSFWWGASGSISIDEIRFE